MKQLEIKENLKFNKGNNCSIGVTIPFTPISRDIWNANQKRFLKMCNSLKKVLMNYTKQIEKHWLTSGW